MLMNVQIILNTIIKKLSCYFFQSLGERRIIYGFKTKTQWKETICCDDYCITNQTYTKY